jgi:hypothetical protein
MARYSAFLGCKVEVQYRAGDILLPASGIFVADSGRSIFLEQNLVQRGQPKYFRWEIPYQYIVRLERAAESEDPLSPQTAKPVHASAKEQADSDRRAAHFPGVTTEASPAPASILPLRNRAKTA